MALTSAKLISAVAAPIHTADVQEARFGWSPAFGGITFLLGRNFNTRIPGHLHAMYVLGVVDEGAVRVTIRGDEHIARAGSVIALRPFEAHAEYALEGSGWSFRYLYLTEAQVCLAMGLEVGLRNSALKFKTPILENDALAAAIGSVHDIMREGRPVQEVEESLRSMLLLAARCRTEPPSTSNVVSRRRIRVRDAQRLIVAQGLRRVTIAELAAVAGVSESRFSRVFHGEVGLPPYAYFDHVRIARAHQMIGAGARISDVAYVLGFSDQAHLTRHFHRASFMTPGQYASIARGMFGNRGLRK
jgi:AraC-like DNA-binding protein